jgi:hypothetical protein
MYAIVFGGVAPGLVIRHMCDRPACVNPCHLLEGTLADKAADRHERRRDFWRERQQEGIVRAKAEGAYKGRKPSIDTAKVLEMRAQPSAAAP